MTIYSVREKWQNNEKIPKNGTDNKNVGARKTTSILKKWVRKLGGKPSVGLTGSTWIACIFSGPEPCTRNNARPSSVYVTSGISVSAMCFLYPSLRPPW